MQLYNYLKPKMQFIGTLVMAFAMFSCGSYQYAGYENDSIYGDSERTVEYVNEEPAADNSQYYKNYFKEKTEQYAAITDGNDVIFTDIDSYEGGYVEENDTLYYDNYAGWGEDNSDVTINIYGGHAFNSIWWNRPYATSWGWNYGYGYGNVWGYGFNNFGWNRPLWLDYGYGWGWNRPYWGIGYYNNFPYFGNGYYGSGYYGGGYYRNRSLAFNSTRRGSAYGNIGNSPNVISRRSSVNSSNTTRRTVSSNLNRRSTANNRSTINNRRRIGTNSNSSRTRIGTNNTSRSRVGTNSSRSRPTTTRSNSSRSRSNTSTRSNRSINNSSSRNISRSNSSSRNNVSRSSSTRSSSSKSSGSRSSSRSNNTSKRGNN